MKVSNVFEGAGAAILLLAPRLADILSPYHLSLYHSLLPVNTLSGGVFFELATVSVLFAFIFSLLDRIGTSLQSLLGMVLIVLTVKLTIVALPLPEARPETSFSILTSLLLALKEHQVILLSVCALFVFALWLWKKQYSSTGTKGVRLYLVLVGVSALWILPQLAYQAVHRQIQDVKAYWRPLPSQANASLQRRIVWILFDELAYRHLFEDRPEDVQGENFDQLRSESYSFSQVQADGTKTDHILPALFLGKHVESIRSNLDGALAWKSKEEDGWTAFDEKKSLFAEAQKDGWSTGVVGYYNPYCRILPTVLNSCYWMSEETPGGHMSPTLGALQNALRPLQRILQPSVLKKEGGQYQQHVRAYEDGHRESQRLLQNENVHFVFVHVGIPHPPSIYNRKKKTMAPGSYADNLELANRELGAYLQTVRRSPSADKTTIIVSSDHAWRTWMWKGDPLNWGPEDSKQAGRGTDSRPVLLVHLPGQKQRHEIAKKFPELKEHDVIKAMLAKPDFSEKDMEQTLSEIRE